MTMLERVAAALGTDEVHARAAIEAMREPTDEMLRSMENDSALDWAPFVWERMIASALEVESRV